MNNRYPKSTALFSLTLVAATISCIRKLNPGSSGLAASMSTSGRHRVQEAITNRTRLASTVKDQIALELTESDIRQWYRCIVMDRSLTINSEISLESIPHYFKSFGIHHQLVARKVIDQNQPVITLNYTGGVFEILIIIIGPKNYVPVTDSVEPAGIPRGKVYNGVYVFSTIE